MNGSIIFCLQSIILKILQYSGIIIRDPQIVQTAAQLVQQDTVNEKS